MMCLVPKKIWLFLSLSCLALFAKGQASYEVFGQQRIQYKTFEWKYFDSTHFRTFYYKPGEDIAIYVLNEAEKELSNIVQVMGGRLPRKLNIVIYNSYSDFIQTNIGRQNDGAFNQADGGKVEVVGDNIPIYFTGNHDELKEQVRKGVAKVIKDNMLFGDNLKEVVKNAIKLNLPEWYTQGYVQYISEEWTPEKQTEIQSLIDKDTNFKFTEIATSKPQLLGHSFWYFLSNAYGENYVSNLLYLTRYRKGVNDALKSVLGKNSDSIYNEWKIFYSSNNKSAKDELFGRTLATELPSKFNASYSQFHLSPNGQQLAYVEKKEGIWSIYLQETDLRDTKVLVTGGVRNLKETDDPNYPLLAWSPNGKKLAVLYQVKNQLLLRLYNAQTQRKSNKLISTRKIERVTGFCFGATENEFIFSGIHKGQSDIFKYSIQGNAVTNITNDNFDDKDPAYHRSGGRNGILFLSNRTKTILDDPLAQSSQQFDKHFNLYFLDSKVGKQVYQVSHTEKKIYEPQQFGLEKFSYIEEKDKKRVRKIVDISPDEQKGISFEISEGASIPFSILHQQYLPTTNSLVEVIKHKGMYKVFNTNMENLEKYNQDHPLLENIDPEKNIPPIVPYPKYITEFANDDTTSTLYNIFTKKSNTLVNKIKENAEQGLLKQKYKKYKATFYPDFVMTSLDNSLLFTRYQPYTPGGAGFQFPDLNGFISASLNDIMEDYKITAGFRMPLDFNGFSYFLEFANYKKRRDWKISYFHQHNNVVFPASQAPDSLSTPYPTFSGKNSTDYLQSTFIHPFNSINSLHVNIGVRYDRTRYLAMDKYSIAFPNKQDIWSFARVEYVYDNSINPILNIWKGSRAKVFGEYQYKLNSPSKGFYNLGFDGRNYTTLYKNCILASRIAGGFSGGSAKLLYYLGGVDNPIIIDPSKSIELNNLPDPNEPYAFQTTATNLRGYKLQARNGNSFTVINEEIRLPIYNTFFKRSIKSGFIRNLQLVSFVDIGAAWRGLMPNEDNLSTNVFIQNQNVLVQLQDTESYLGIGYGLGVRTRLLGYFLRLDAAWNIEGSKRPLWHLSLATDF